MRPPEFLMVSPKDIGRVGVLGAAILALVRYATGLPGVAGGRKMVDGEMWWCASRDDIGEALGGVHRDSVRRALLKLVNAGELLAMPAERFYGDRAQAYRVSDVPLRGTQQGSDMPLRESAQCITRNTTSSSRETQPAAHADPRNLPITGELEEHSVKEKTRTRGTRLDPAWIPPQEVIDQMRAECPGVDLRAEHRKFVDYWTDQTGSKATKRSWVGTWRNWIRKAAESPQRSAFGVERDAAGRSRGEAKVAGWMELGRPETDVTKAIEV